MKVRALFLLCIIFCFAIAPVQGFLITSFCPDTYLSGEDDEFFVISGTGSAEGLSVTDKEGTLYFPSGTMLSGETNVARRAIAFYSVHGKNPDFELFDTDPKVPEILRRGNFRMANTADELITHLPDGTVIEVSWPEIVTPREGQVHYFSEKIWDPRPLIIGQSDFDSWWVDNVSGTVFVSPDCSSEVLKSTIDEAQKELLINVYTFTGAGIASLVNERALTGVQTTILLEGGPVGGISSEEKAVVSYLTTNGSLVYAMQSTDQAHARYRYDHAKYLCVDNTSVLVTSENFGDHGFPPEGESGNRGWGVRLDNQEITSYFRTVFEEDNKGGDIISLSFSDVEAEPISSDAEFVPTFAPLPFSDAQVRPVLAPENSFLIPATINTAKTSIVIEQAYIKNWSSGTNPYLEAAINASRRGVDVRILLDATYYNLEGDQDNDEMVEYINRVATAEILPLQARIVRFEAEDPIKIHNKGMIIDTETVLIGSINWNENSPLFNREVAVLLRHPGVGAYFTKVFDYDWNAGRSMIPPGPDGVKIAVGCGVIVLLSLLYLMRRR